MTNSTIIDFHSRECKTNKHHMCISRWHGLGLEIYCNCDCHYKKGDVLVKVHGPETNPINEMQPPISVARGKLSDSQ